MVWVKLSKTLFKRMVFLGLYKGLESTLWRHIWWNAGYFGCIHQVRSLMPKPKDSSQKTLIDLTCGTIGGTFGTMLNTPFDVVKSRIQAGSTQYKWTYPSILKVAREEGFGALYKGFIPKVLRLGPGGGILLVVFTTCMDFFRTLQDKNRLTQYIHIYRQAYLYILTNTCIYYTPDIILQF